MSAQLEITDEVAVLNLGDDENRFSPDWLTDRQRLSRPHRVGRGQGAGHHRIRQVLLQRPGSGSLAAHGDQHGWYVDQVQRLFAQVLVALVPTVAAVNGHAFGAGQCSVPPTTSGSCEPTAVPAVSRVGIHIRHRRGWLPSFKPG